MEINLGVLQTRGKDDAEWASVPAIKGDKGDPYVLTDTDKQEIVEETINALPVYNGENEETGEASGGTAKIEVLIDRFIVNAVYKVGTYTDVHFDIYKEGYTPVSIMPKTSGNGDVLVLGYGFWDNSGLGEVDYNRATVTFRSIASAQVEGGAKIEVIYIKTGQGGV